ncbi:hypothetical protein B6U98_01525 [Thermoplasmatales archaeon ex4572_165]|nr:MAG: hypothetical protein B6U98_01525 [Thermoplasmatales archaeon ex4572_165]
MKKIICISICICMITTVFPVINAVNESKNNEWFFYPSYENYSPKGMPDFDQKQNNWKDPYNHGWTFCGAVSVANIFWYIDSSYSNSYGCPGDNEDIFPLVLNYNAQGTPIPGLNKDDHNFNNVNDLTSVWDHEKGIFGNELIERVAWYVDTNGCRTGNNIWGTPIISMHQGVSKWLDDAGLLDYFKLEIKYPKSITSNSIMPSGNHISSYFSNNTHGNLVGSYDFLETEFPISSTEDLTFQNLANQIINGSFVVLGLTGYDEDKNVYISHWVSVAGVNINDFQIALSDPYFDNANHTNDMTKHNDASIVSHDIYRVNNTSPFPDEKDYFWLVDYLNIPNVYTIVPAVFIITPLKDNIPEITPRSYFIKPDTNYLFLNDKHIMKTLFGNTVVIGDLAIEANAYSREGIEKIEFYLNDELMHIDDVFPYEWFWDDTSFGRFEVKIKAIDNTGIISENEMIIWKFDL